MDARGELRTIQLVADIMRSIQTCISHLNELNHDPRLATSANRLRPPQSDSSNFPPECLVSPELERVQVMFFENCIDSLLISA